MQFIRGVDGPPAGVCPGCSEPRGGRYRHNGRELCWPCWMSATGLGPLPGYQPAPDPEWVTFRKTIVDALWALDPQRFHYITVNRVAGACPACIDGRVRVDFCGRAPRADLVCSFGCPEFDIAHAIAARPRETVR